MQISPFQLFKHCYCKYAILAVNVWSMEEVLALFSAATKAKAPFIVQTTPVARNYGGETMLLNIIDAAAQSFPEALFSIHLDHGNKDHAEAAIRSERYSSVMIDGSHLPYQENVKLTASIVERAHKKGINVEAELGILSGVEDGTIVSEKDKTYTNPGEVVSFVHATQCDSLAIAIGTSHGAYKFKGKQGINLELLKAIQDKVPGFPLVLHGGSAIDQAEVDRINHAGGALAADATGVSPSEIKEAIKYGICKINVASDLRLIWARVHREFFMNEPALFDPLIPGKTYMAEIEKMLLEKFALVGAVEKSLELVRENII